MSTHILRRGDNIRSLSGWNDLMGLGIGNVYRVIKSSEAYYGQFIEDYQFEYSDGSLAVHADDGSGDGIQSALDACVECRNDYVIVQPSDSDYDLTAVLTLSKKGVHLICPAGIGNEYGANGACRLHQTTAATDVFAMSDSSIEIAGFYLKNYQNISHITMAATSYSPNIHHNTFTMNITSTTAEACIAGTGDAGAWGTGIYNNWFVSYAGTSATIASIITIGSSATAAHIEHNRFTIGDGNTATVCITNSAVKGGTNYNLFETGGGTYGGTITHCVSIHASGSAIGNRATVADGVIVVGGTSDSSFSDNMNGAGGGAVDDED